MVLTIEIKGLSGLEQYINLVIACYNAQGKHAVFAPIEAPRAETLEGGAYVVILFCQ